MERNDGVANNEDEEADEEDFSEGFRGDSTNTTLRKSAAYSLAQFSKTF